MDSPKPSQSTCTETMTQASNGQVEFRYLDEEFTLVGRGHWIWKSWSEEGEHHSLDSETWECSCPGFTFRKTCRHIDLLKELLDAPGEVP